MDGMKQPRRITRQEVLDKIFSHARSGSGQTRVVQLSVPGREITLAHVIGMPDASVYVNLCLDIGFHAGAKPAGTSIGILQLSPPETAVIAADIAVKSGDVDIGFMDRFSGALIITGRRAEVDAAIGENIRFFRDDLHYTVCPVSYQ